MGKHLVHGGFEDELLSFAKVSEVTQHLEEGRKGERQLSIRMYTSKIAYKPVLSS